MVIYSSPDLNVIYYITLLGEISDMPHFYIAVYSKVKTKSQLKELVRANPADPKVDLQDPMSGQYATPNLIREYLKIDQFEVYGPKPSSWYAQLTWKDIGWSVK